MIVGSPSPSPDGSRTDAVEGDGLAPLTLHEILASENTALVSEWRPDRDSHVHSVSTICTGDQRAYCPSGYPGWDGLTFLGGAMARSAIEAML